MINADFKKVKMDILAHQLAFHPPDQNVFGACFKFMSKPFGRCMDINVTVPLLNILPSMSLPEKERWNLYFFIHNEIVNANVSIEKKIRTIIDSALLDSLLGFVRSQVWTGCGTYEPFGTCIVRVCRQLVVATDEGFQFALGFVHKAFLVCCSALARDHETQDGSTQCYAAACVLLCKIVLNCYLVLKSVLSSENLKVMWHAHDFAKSVLPEFQPQFVW